MAIMRRTRGVILRLGRRRKTAMALGFALAAPAAWVELAAHDPAWWAEGLALILGATGVALFWTGLTGGGPDYISR
jgi:hypothetical protein